MIHPAAIPFSLNDSPHHPTIKIVSQQKFSLYFQ